MICCIQVVPDLPQLAIMMSSGRKGKSFQRVVSIWWVWSSKILTGHWCFVSDGDDMLMLFVVSALCVEGRTDLPKLHFDGPAERV
jgi:hypothetical protein